MAEFKERTKEEWAIAAKKELATANEYCKGSLDHWSVTESGRQYQVMEGGRVIFSHKSIWEVRKWVFENVRYPYAYGEPPLKVGETSDKLQSHYDNLFVPNHPKDENDYSLTDNEKAEIKQEAIAHSEEGITILSGLVKHPHILQIDGEYSATTVKQLAIVDAETGEILKKNTSSWVLKLWYEKTILRSW